MLFRRAFEYRESTTWMDGGVGFLPSFDNAILILHHSGFGSHMAGSPMVIMWSNSDGTITLSQRSASSEVQPKLDSNPPRVASLLTNLSSVRLNVSYSCVNVRYLQFLPVV